MAAIDKRGAFTDPWGREFLSDGTPLDSGKQGEDQPQVADGDELSESEDQLSDDKDENAKTGASLSQPTTTAGTSGKTLPKIKLKLTPNYDGPESEEETGTSEMTRPPLPPQKTGATDTLASETISTAAVSTSPVVVNTLGGKTVPITKTKAKEVLSIRDPPCWRCKTLDKPCESSSLRFSCTMCYKRHWACSVNPPPPRQKKGHGGGGGSTHSAPPKTRSLPATTTPGATVDPSMNDVAGAESISTGPVFPHRSVSAKSVTAKRPRSPTPTPREEGDPGPVSSGISAPQNKKTRTSMRTIAKPQPQHNPQPISQQPRTQPPRSQSKVSGGSSTFLNQGSVRPISISPASQSQPTIQSHSPSQSHSQLHLQSNSSTIALGQPQPQVPSSQSTQTIAISNIPELKSLQTQVDQLVQRNEQSQSVLEKHTAMLDALLGNMKVLLGSRFIDVGEERPAGISQSTSTLTQLPAKDKRKENPEVATFSSSSHKAVAPASHTQDAEMEELDELDELSPVENANQSLLLPSVSATLGVNGHGHGLSHAAPAGSNTLEAAEAVDAGVSHPSKSSYPSVSVPPSSSSSAAGLMGPAVSGSRQAQSSQRVDQPPRVISVAPVRTISTGASKVTSRETPPVSTSRETTRNNLPSSASLPSSVSTLSSAQAPSASSLNVDHSHHKAKPKPKGKNPYPNIPAIPATNLPAQAVPLSTLIHKDHPPQTLSGSSAPAPVYPSTAISPGSSNEPSHSNSNTNIPTISTLPIPTISSIPATTTPVTMAAAPLSPASTASAIDVDNDNDAEKVVQGGEIQAPSSRSYSHSRTGHDIVDDHKNKSHTHDSRRPHLDPEFYGARAAYTNSSSHSAHRRHLSHTSRSSHPAHTVQPSHRSHHSHPSSQTSRASRGRYLSRSPPPYGYNSYDNPDGYHGYNRNVGHDGYESQGRYNGYVRYDRHDSSDGSDGYENIDDREGYRDNDSRILRPASFPRHQTENQPRPLTESQARSRPLPWSESESRPRVIVSPDSPRSRSSSRTQTRRELQATVPAPPADRFSSTRPVSERFYRLSPLPPSHDNGTPPPHHQDLPPFSRDSSDMHINSLVGNDNRSQSRRRRERKDLVDLDFEDLRRDVPTVGGTGHVAQGSYEDTRHRGDRLSAEMNDEFGVDPILMDGRGREGSGGEGEGHSRDLKSGYQAGDDARDELDVPDAMSEEAYEASEVKHTLDPREP
ncbi:hypothetical protein EV360DRAFT_84674 [Lentinula raphanica]|nr:hypothetical protein EV360DRAFT_84674 [Lentinula raphanica]